MKRFLRFGMSSHSSPIETGRHHRPAIPRTTRLCPHCSLSLIGDEQHFVFECPFLQPIRSQFQSLFTPHTTTMRTFFAQKDRMGVFKFVLDCLDVVDV